MMLRSIFELRCRAAVFTGFYFSVWPIPAPAEAGQTLLELRSGFEKTASYASLLAGASIRTEADVNAIKLRAALELSTPEHGSDGNWRSVPRKHFPFPTFSVLQINYRYTEENNVAIGKFGDEYRELAPRISPYTSVQWTLGKQQLTAQTLLQVLRMRSDVVDIYFPERQTVRQSTATRTLLEAFFKAEESSLFIRVFKYTSHGANFAKFTNGPHMTMHQYPHEKARSFSILESEWDLKFPLDINTETRAHATTLFNADAASRNFGFDVFTEIGTSLTEELKARTAVGFRNIGAKAAPALHYEDGLLPNGLGLTGVISIDQRVSPQTTVIVKVRAILPTHRITSSMDLLGLLTLSHIFR